ncbi:MAG: diaminopimelate epimerase [Bacteroidales bacterium]|nr:diaminopimelate epimerase [Bacteroidales bacterium]
MKFYKFTGAGNDFILFNDLNNTVPIFSAKQIQFLCNRHFGIGADGIMILKKSDVLDFEMDYFNPDGSGGTMCGNGGRCIVAFAQKLGIIERHTKFIASDGLHEAFVSYKNIVKLKMADVDNIKKTGKDYFCNTGAPHHIIFTENIDDINVYEEGRKVRYSKRYKENGTNVNFVKIKDNHKIKIRTYERGVENETLACGTGSVAAALTCAEINEFCSGEVTVHTKGGMLKVSFIKQNDSYEDIWLTGPADFVFEGEINL